MFVDASAVVAILTREPEADALADQADEARAPITSPIALLEAALGTCRKRHASVEEAEEDVREFLKVAGVELVPITAKEAETALSTFSRYGKGRGHPAQLNLGDCFVYAVAKNHRKALLFKGDDFDKTDICSSESLSLNVGREERRLSLLHFHPLSGSPGYKSGLGGRYLLLRRPRGKCRSVAMTFILAPSLRRRDKTSG